MPLDLDLLVSEFLDKLIRREQESRNGPSSQSTPSGSTASVTVPTLPWESWELDRTFFNTLSQWSSDHSGTTLDQVLERIYVGLENGKELFNLIPESLKGLPLPARGLVTALAHLVMLGVKIARAKKQVHDFAKAVVHWVEQVKGAFESAKDGQFTKAAWRDLESMRKLIEEICVWAVLRLTDRRWKRIVHGLTIQKEITEFCERIAEAQRLFQDLSAVNLARGVDAITRDLRTLFQKQDRILTEIKKVRELQERRLASIEDKMDAVKEEAERERFFAETLATRTVADPTYDKQGKRPCDPDTRVEVLKKIRIWVNDITSGSPNFLWLTGDPGCGKSAITASLARECKDKNILWA